MIKQVYIFEVMLLYCLHKALENKSPNYASAMKMYELLETRRNKKIAVIFNIVERIPTTTKQLIYFFLLKRIIFNIF